MAVADPLDPFTPAAIAAATGLPVDLLIGLPVELDAALTRLYPDGAVSAEPDPAAAEPLEEDAERLKDLASEAPVIRLVNGLISRAVETLASDIHIEPFEDRLRVRYRYDGVLHEAESPATHLTPAIISRIKIMARLDIAERRLPQDGRIKLAVRGQEIDFRVSTIPSLYGETVVLRVLDRSAVSFEYGKLGLSAPVIARLDAALQLPNGIAPGDRADRVGQDDDAVYRAAVAQFRGAQGRHRRGPDRVSAAGREPDPRSSRRSV